MGVLLDIVVGNQRIICTMSKIVALICLCSILGLTVADNFNCKPGNDNGAGFPREVCYVKACADKIRSHIKEELNAAFYYMYLGARFDQDTVNRPGIAKFLYESASEEREHAIQMLTYLNSRGISFDESYEFGPSQMMKLEHLIKNLDYKSALETALNLEIDVTQKIYDIVETCTDDFHSADVFTNPILAEQHEGVRKLQGAIQTFSDLTKSYTNNPNELFMTEYLFDQK